MIAQAFQAIACAQQGQFESRSARCVGGQRAGGPRPRAPSRLRCARDWSGRSPGDQHRCSRCFGRQPEAAAGGEVVGLRLTPKLDQNRAQGRAARTLKPCLKRRLRIADADKDQPRRVEPEFRNARRAWRAELAVQRGVPNPEIHGWLGDLGRRQSDSGQTCAIGFGSRVELVQSIARKMEPRQHFAFRSGHGSRQSGIWMAFCSLYVPIIDKPSRESTQQMSAAHKMFRRMLIGIAATQADATLLLAAHPEAKGAASLLSTLSGLSRRRPTSCHGKPSTHTRSRVRRLIRTRRTIANPGESWAAEAQIGPADRRFSLRCKKSPHAPRDRMRREIRRLPECAFGCRPRHRCRAEILALQIA
jgi:hypothetical protein